MSVEAHEVIPMPQPDIPGREESIPEAARRKLSSPWATGLVILITILWTIPTFGLLVTSLRPAEQATSTGWWTRPLRRARQHRGSGSRSGQRPRTAGHETHAQPPPTVASARGEP